MVFKKGKSGNPLGRPKSPVVEEFRLALAEIEQKKGKTFLKHICEKAFQDDRIAIEVLKKIVPDLTKADMDIAVQEKKIILNVIKKYK